MRTSGAAPNKKNHRAFKKGIDQEESRRRREDVTIELRKEKRDKQLQKRRQKNGGIPTTSPEKISAATSQAASGVRHTAEIEEKLKLLPQLVEGVNSDNSNNQVECVTHFRKLLSIERNPPIQEVIDCGVVPRLVHFLTFNHNHTLQFEVAWALTNIASGTTQHTRHVIQHGAIGLFVQLLRSPNEDVKEQAVWALGNIAGDSPEYRDLVLRNQALEPLLALCTPDAKLTMLRNATWTLSNFCRGKPQPPFELVRPALQTLANLISSKDDDVLTDACWALSYLSDDTGPHNQKIQAVIQAGVCGRLVTLLMHKSPNVKTPALRTVGNIVTGDDIQTQMVIDCNVLPCLLALLVNPKKGIRKEACWTISNITAGNHTQIRTVIEANIIPPLVKILRNGEFDIQKEAAWAISNATSGGKEEQIRYLVSQGVIGPLCDLFVCEDSKIVMVAMEGIENILRVGKQDAIAGGGGANFDNGCNTYSQYVEECGGLDNLEALQRHENEEIYDKAVKILRDYFDSEEDENAALAPTQMNNAFLFGATSNVAPPGGFTF